MPGIRDQFSSKGPAISRAIPALAAIEAGNPALSPAFGGAYDAAWRSHGQSDSLRSLFNPHRLRVYLNSAENFPQNADTLVNFDTVTGTGTRDPMNGFSTSAHTYTVQPGGAGTWLIAATIGYNVPAVANANQLYQVWIYINGSVFAKGPVSPFFQGSIGSSQPTSAFVGDEVDLNQGDVVAIHLVAGATGGTATAITGSVNTYWTMRLDNVQGG